LTVQAAGIPIDDFNVLTITFLPLQAKEVGQDSALDESGAVFVHPVETSQEFAR